MTFVDVSNLFPFDVQALKPAFQIKRVIEGINSTAGSTNKGDTSISGIFLSDGRICTGNYLRPKFGVLSYDEKRKLGKTCDGETGPNAKSNRRLQDKTAKDREG